MRRLTLILSDLYLPEDSARGTLPTAVDLPSLDQLLRFAARPRRITDWRRWLSGAVGLHGLASLPVAQACARHVLSPPEVEASWLAVPVHLEARLDHVRLGDRGLLRLDARERQALCSEFDAALGPRYRLHDMGERGFLLSGLARTPVTTVDPARLLDADIAPALARGPEAVELRRLGAEIEMWLHAAPLNTARERNRQPRISALWLWGGGSRDGDTVSSDAAGNAAARTFHFVGADPFLAAIARALAEDGKAATRSDVATATFAVLAPESDDVVVEIAPLTGASGNALQSLEADWFAPVRAALAERTLAEFVFVANDRCFVVTPGRAWKLWRSRTPWLMQLAASR